jgi:hypothetical protein
MLIELRSAKPSDAALLQGMEQATSVRLLSHIFPPERFPYPAEEVRARWTGVLASEAYSCLIANLGYPSAMSHGLVT